MLLCGQLSLIARWLTASFGFWLVQISRWSPALNSSVCRQRASWLCRKSPPSRHAGVNRLPIGHIPLASLQRSVCIWFSGSNRLLFGRVAFLSICIIPPWVWLCRFSFVVCHCQGAKQFAAEPFRYGGVTNGNEPYIYRASLRGKRRIVSKLTREI